MSDEDRKKLIQKFGKANFGTPIRKKRGMKTEEEFITQQKPVSAFNMARRV